MNMSHQITSLWRTFIFFCVLWFFISTDKHRFMYMYQFVILSQHTQMFLLLEEFISIVNMLLYHSISLYMIFTICLYFMLNVQQILLFMHPTIIIFSFGYVWNMMNCVVLLQLLKIHLCTPNWAILQWLYAQIPTISIIISFWVSENFYIWSHS